MRASAESRAATPRATIDSMKDDLRDPETSVATLANGVRVMAIRQPHVETVGVSVFVAVSVGKTNGVGR